MAGVSDSKRTRADTDLLFQAFGFGFLSLPIPPPFSCAASGEFFDSFGFAVHLQDRGSTGVPKVVKVYRSRKEWFVAVVATFVSNKTTPTYTARFMSKESKL